MSSLNTLALRLLAVIIASMISVGCQSLPDPQNGTGNQVSDSVTVIDRRIWFAAADAGDTEILQALLEDGLNPLIERQGLTALHIAARHDYRDAVVLLIDAGVDVNLVPDEQEAALAAAAGHGSRQLLDMIVGYEMDPEAIASVVNRRSPLNLAVENGHAETVALLIAAGADVNAHGEWYSPLHSAILYGDAGIVELLLANGARADMRIRIHDRSKFAGFRYVRPVELARMIERNDLVELLRRHGGSE